MSSYKDIVLQDKKICFYFKYLDWDSSFFDKPSYVLDIEKSNIDISDEIKVKIKEAFINSFVTIKINTSIDNKIIDFLQDCKFKYIDTEVVLKYKNIDIEKPTISDIYIEKTKNNIGLPYEELGSTFNLTRFHSEKNISNDMADLLWIEYLRNYKVTDKKHMFIARQNDNILGTILVNIIDNIAYVFFVGILDKYRSLGIGTKLMIKVTNYFSDYTIQTGTQIKNVGALNFYLRNGFSKIEQTNIVLHYWG